MANKNTGLGKAKSSKKDEFYTRLEDIENELKHYKKHFKGKVVLCNCDDPYESNFFKYFAMNFNKLGLKKLITTCYKESSIADTQLSLFDDPETPDVERPPAFKLEITSVQDFNNDGAINIYDVEWLIRNDGNVLTPLSGDGDFRSDECIEMLKEADVVVTNPPFSLFRDYVMQLMEFEKKFLIIGHQNAITYREIFPFLKENKMWLGFGFKRNCAHFISPYEDTASDLDHRDGMVRISGVTWYTNMDISKRHEEYPLYKSYSPEEYQTYDNFDAIEVSKTQDIPCDYAGLMGVPITFMYHYNPDQFEIIGSFNAGADGEEIGAKSTDVVVNGKEQKWNGPVVNKKALYKRIVIRNLCPELEE